jgi:hypothetical protein
MLETSDVTGQALVRPYTIHYQPSRDLAQGSHEVIFSVRDQKGNLAVKRWKFEIKAAGGAIQISATNIIDIARNPMAKATDTLDLSAQTRLQLQETNFQLHLQGSAADYPNGITPDYQDNGINYYLEKYSFGINHQNIGLTLGYATSPLQSELLQLNYEVTDGGVLSDAFGQYKWAVFSGKMSTSYGINMSVYNVSGFTGSWNDPAGNQVNGYYVDLGDAGGYTLIGMNGNTMIGKTMLFRYEAIHSAAKKNEITGNGAAVHVDMPVGVTTLGFDYTLLQSGYPDIETTTGLSPKYGGIQRYGIRSYAPIGKSQILNFEGTFSEDNLDNSQNTTNCQENVNLGYTYRPDTTFTLNANYQGDRQFASEDTSENSSELNHAFLVNMVKQLAQSSIQSTLTFNRSAEASPDENDTGFFTAWTKPLGAYNLTPSIQWLNDDKSNGDYSKSLDARLTLDLKFHPDVSRSTFSLFRKTTDVCTYGTTTYETEIGLDTQIYVLLWHNSTLMVTFDRSHYAYKNSSTPAGWDLTLSASWKLIF